MVKTQIEYSKLLSELIALLKECNIDFNAVDDLKSAVNEMTLPIAVVGEFSAGKSTLLNNFTGKNLLPTNVKAETAIAAELYYSENEYTEAVKEDGSVVRLNSNDPISSGFSYVKRYINSENLKAIQPLILVDMPGFDSPHNNHNKAIMSYLDKAVHYIVLTPVDSGTITSSMARQLQNIQEFKKDFSFL